MNGALFVGLIAAGIAATIALLMRSRVKKRLADATGREEIDVLAQTSTRENLRQLVEDAGAMTETQDPGWRPARFNEPRMTPPIQIQQDKASTPESLLDVTSDRLVPSKEWVQVGQVFSPSAPISRHDLFAGRHQQMEALIDVAFERGQHAAMYGERGVGKTSLATIMAMVFNVQATKFAIKVNCDATDTYDSLWRKTFDELEFAARSSGDIPQSDLVRLQQILSDLPESELTPNEVRKALRLVTTVKEPIVFLDEFERLRGRSVKAHFADTLKKLSDQDVPSTIVVVGVADDIDDLLSEHRSLERALVQVHMPRMAQAELGEIVKRGLELVDMKIEDAALDLITWLSQGLPHFTHLLAQASARAATDEKSREVQVTHLFRAVRNIYERAPESILTAYQAAVQSARETLYPQVLLAAAMARTDKHGFFAAADLVMPLAAVAQRPYDIPAFSRHLHGLSSHTRGAVLVRKGASHRYRFRFNNALLQPYVLMQGVATGMIDIAKLPNTLIESP
jgi:Cdc6-like AAA superfamily ATPase